MRVKNFKTILCTSAAIPLLFTAPAYAYPAPYVVDTTLQSANGISGDGSTVFGFSQASGFGIWTFEDGAQDLGKPAFAAFAYVNGASQDGSVLVGLSRNGLYSAVKYTAGDGFVFLNGIYTGNSFANAVDSDGGIIAGTSTGIDSKRHAVIWDHSNSPTQFAELAGGDHSEAYGISGDGTIVVGYSTIAGALERPTSWTSGGAPVALGLPALHDEGEAYAISRDGSTIVGEVSISGDLFHAVKWQGTTPTLLGTLAGDDDSYANAVSANGSVIVGQGDHHAFRWTASDGIKDLNTLLTDASVDMTGITLINATGVSDNGNYLVANSADSAYLVFYNAGIGGVTTLADQQTATQNMVSQMSNMMAQSGTDAQMLLGSTTPITNYSYTFMGGMFGSAEGSFGGQFARDNNTLRGGVSYGHQDYKTVDQSDSVTLALAGRHMFEPVSEGVRPYAEIGGWSTPNESLTFQRPYANGAGTALGEGTAGAYSLAGYGQLGIVWDITPKDRLGVFGELGQQVLSYDSYSEELSTSNPFPATVQGGMVRAKVIRWGGSLTHSIDGGPVPLSITASGALDHAFDVNSNLRATVAGIGTTQAAATDSTWVEFGMQLTAQLSEQWSGNVGFVGTSGDSQMDTQLHGTVGLSYKF